MAPQPISINISAPKAANYMPVSPYTSDEHTFPGSLLCPERDSASAPPSPASIESFDILDPVAWRRGHTSLDPTARTTRSCEIWRRQKSQFTCILVVMIFLITGCSLGASLAVRHERNMIKEDCFNRGGESRCEQPAWAKCVAMNGLGYCEGVMGEDE